MKQRKIRTEIDFFIIVDDFRLLVSRLCFAFIVFENEFMGRAANELSDV